jgi:AraC family transcriptional regulator
MTTLVATLLRLAGETQQQRTSPRLSKTRAQKVTTYLNTHWDEMISIRTLAGLLGLEEFYFAKAFKRTFGEFPYRFCLRRRVGVARHLILTTKMSLAEVAAEVGFSSQAHFTKVFKSLQGVTPGRLRRESPSS